MVDEVLVRQDVLSGWRPVCPLTVMQYRSLHGEHAMVNPVSHYTGLADVDYGLPLEKLVAAFGLPLPIEKGAGIGRGYWWGGVDEGGWFTGVWIVVHTDRVRFGGLAQVRCMLTRPFSGRHWDGDQIMHQGVTDLVEWLKKR